MPLTRNGIPAPAVAQLLAEHLRHRSLENFCASAPSPQAMYRRLYDILHGKSQLVSLRVVDEICTVAGRPDWLQLLS